MGLRERLRKVMDLHVHTGRSPCAVPGYGVDDVAEAAIERGVSVVAITDHYHGPGNKSTLDDLRKEVKRARWKYAGKLKILLGAEADILTVDGELSIEPEVARSLDILLAGIHFVPAGGRCLPPEEKARVTPVSDRFLEILEEGGLWDFVADVMDAILAAVEGGLVSVIAHPLTIFADLGLTDARRGPIRRLSDLADDRYWERLFDAARRLRVCFEVNNKFPVSDEGWGGLSEFVRRAASSGVKISLGSDAHRPEDAGHLDGALSFLERCGVPPEAVVDSLADFRRPAEGL